jgi:hypothetical protein
METKTTKHIYCLKNERVATQHTQYFGVEHLPVSVDLRPKFPFPCFDQGELGKKNFIYFY